MTIKNLKNSLKLRGDKKQAEILQKFFKTGKGQYGEGDIFLGVRVPDTRKIVNQNLDISLDGAVQLLNSKIHEERLASILLLVTYFQQALKNEDTKKQKIIFDLYISNAKKINNWDLVDLSAPKLSGPYLFDKSREILYSLAKSDNLWEKRIAIISTFEFIRNNQFDDTFKITEILLSDKHDLMHKACGWMLREVGKRDENQLENFLKKNFKKMPRTMLRYSIEKFDEKKRLKYLKMN
jgi:3-methyladenine DNA glycosylase AlkD